MAKLPPANASDAELAAWALGAAGVDPAKATPEDYQRVVAKLVGKLEGIKRKRGRPTSHDPRKLFIAVQTLRSEMEQKSKAAWDAAKEQRREQKRQAALEIKRRNDAEQPIGQRLLRQQKGTSRRPVGIKEAIEQYHAKERMPGDWTSTRKRYNRARKALVEEYGMGSDLLNLAGKATQVELSPGDAYPLDRVLEVLTPPYKEPSKE